MTNLQQRQNEIKTKIAAAAFKQPILNSGLLFHHDIRDNFYYASYLFAASQEEAIPFDGDRLQAKIKAEGILFQVLELQDQNEESGTYGHWPLHLRPNPQEAPKNALPVELMGSLMVYFYQRYSDNLSESLRSLFALALLHIYRSNFYRKPSEHYSHHEAKYTAAKLIFGELYDDKALLEDGCQSLRSTLNRVTTIGMSEYGGLPWFWLLRGENSQKIYRLGDKVTVQVIRVNMDSRQIDLGLVEILEAVREGERGPRRSRAVPKLYKKRKQRPGRRERQVRKGGRR